MAVTAGHGNADWSREETILALDLYNQTGGQIPGENDGRVIELSQLLRSLPIHPIELRRESFRNPDGVSFKLQNLKAVATGKGLQNVSKTDRLVWDELGSDPLRVTQLAIQIRAAAATGSSVIADQPPLQTKSTSTLPAQAQDLSDLKPRAGGIVYELVSAAEINVANWSIDKGGNDIEPATNTYRNSQWSYGGGDEPIALCVWWRDLTLEDGLIVYDGNSKEFHTTLGNDLAAPGRSQSEAQRLRGKINKSRTFESKVAEAYRKRKPVRLILLEGEAAGWEVAATTSSKTEARSLDPVPWYVHRYDPFSGAYRFVRGVPLAAPLTPDPFDGAVDPGEDPEFTQFLEDAPLSETEKDALVKLRVGQGYFRTQLIRRWEGCAVTGCRDEGVLIASHIVPWRLCTTRVERLSVSNGLLLTPNLDKLFDRGLISFDARCQILLSSKLTLATSGFFKVDRGMQLRKRDLADIQPFLERHRSEIFQSPAQ